MLSARCLKRVYFLALFCDAPAMVLMASICVLEALPGREILGGVISPKVPVFLFFPLRLSSRMFPNSPVS